MRKDKHTKTYICLFLAELTSSFSLSPFLPDPVEGKGKLEYFIFWFWYFKHKQKDSFFSHSLKEMQLWEFPFSS